MIVSENIAIVVFLSIALVSMFFAWYFASYDIFSGAKFHTFIVVFGGLGVIITFLFYYNVLQLQAEQQILQKLDIATKFNSAWSILLTSMNTASAVVPKFVLSMTPLTNHACKESNISNEEYIGDEPTAEVCTFKMSLSFRIFSLWQDFFKGRDFFDNNISFGYINNFLQKANSEDLHKEWLASKLNFDNTTQSFGDLLFEYGLPITIQIPESYIQAAEKLINDPRYAEL